MKIFYSFLERKAKESDDWIQAQIETRKITAVIAKARKELMFIEGLIKKREDYFKKRKEVTNFRMTSKKKVQTTETTGGNGSAEPDLDDLLLNDDFAPVNYSDSEGEDEDVDEEPEFYPYRVCFKNNSLCELAFGVMQELQDNICKCLVGNFCVPNSHSNWPIC